MKFKYQCVNCGKTFETDDIVYLCDECSKQNTPDKPPKGVLKVLYDYENIKSDVNYLKSTGYIDLLPLRSLDSLPNLRVGGTPIYIYNTLAGEKLNFNLFIKDDSQNPTYSYKDRASAIVSAFARERGIDTIVAASTGNAGSSLAGICAAQGQKAIIYVPESAPIAKLTQILMYGAKLIKVKGNYDMAFELSIEETLRKGWYNRNTAFNPMTIEGKKTVSFELFEQLGYKAPDAVFVPVGDGVIISGVYKGFEDLLKLGLIEKMPVVYAVQAEGSNNLVANLRSGDFRSKPSNTIADSISVDVPRNFYMARDFLLKYGGVGVQVSDDEILTASKIFSSSTGLFAEPASAAAFAGFLKLKNELKPNSNVVVLHTGSGLKDLQAVQPLLG